MYNENTYCEEIDGYEGTWSCTGSIYINGQYLYEMTNEEDNSLIITIYSSGDVYEEDSIVNIF